MISMTAREQAIYDFLWVHLEKDKTYPHRGERILTSFGTKTITGLVACLERIFEETKTTLIIREEQV